MHYFDIFCQYNHSINNPERHFPNRVLFLRINLQQNCTPKRTKVEGISQCTAPVEFHIMKMFMEHPGRVFTRQNIYMAGWEEERIVDDNSIMVCISKLRTKLNDPGSKYISTIRGLGYRFEK